MIKCPGCDSRLIGNPAVCTACRHVLRPLNDDERISQVLCIAGLAYVFVPLLAGYFSERLLTLFIFVGGLIGLCAVLYKMAIGPERFQKWHPAVWAKLLSAAESLEYFYSCAWVPAWIIGTAVKCLRFVGRSMVWMLKIGAGLTVAYLAWAILSRVAGGTGWPLVALLVWFGFYQWDLNSRVSKIEKCLESLPRLNARTDD